MWTRAAPSPLRVGELTIDLVAWYPVPLSASEEYFSHPLPSNSEVNS